MLGLYKYIAHRLSVGYKWEGKWHINHLWQLGGTLLGHIHCPRIYCNITFSKISKKCIRLIFVSLTGPSWGRYIVPEYTATLPIEMHQNPFWQLGGTLSWDTYLVPKFITLHSSVGICIGIWWVLLKGGFISALPSFNLTTRLALMVSIYNVQWLVLAGAQCHQITF